MCKYLVHYNLLFDMDTNFRLQGVRSKSQSGEGIEALAGTNVAQTG